MYTFARLGDSFTLAKENIPRNSLLSELVELCSSKTILIDHIDENEFKALKEYFTNGTIPTIDQYSIFEYMRIDCSSYELSMVIENDIYTNIHKDDIYGLRILSRDFWDNLVIPRLESENTILRSDKVLNKVSYDEILSKLHMFDRILQIKDLFITGEILLAILFGGEIDRYDLCIYGTEMLDLKLDIINSVIDPTEVFRTANFIRCCSDENVDIPLAIYKTKSEIMHSRNINTFGLGYDGKHIYMTRSAEYMLQSGLIHYEKLVNVCYIHKILDMGFGITVPYKNFATVANYINYNRDMHGGIVTIYGKEYLIIDGFNNLDSVLFGYLLHNMMNSRYITPIEYSVHGHIKLKYVCDSNNKHITNVLGASVSKNNEIFSLSIEDRNHLETLIDVNEEVYNSLDSKYVWKLPRNIEWNTRPLES